MKKIYLVLLSIIAAFNTEAITFDSLWKLSSEKSISVPGERKIIPSQYQLAELNQAEFQLFQSFIPTEESGNLVSFFLPTPDGGIMEFNLFEKPMMEKPLADKYPSIKTYTGICKSNPRIIAKFDYTHFGFHAVVFNGDQTFYIDPYTNNNASWYIIYYKKDYSKKINDRMHCMVDEVIELPNQKDPISLSNSLPSLSDFQTGAYKTNGDSLRTYRLALACTEEYSAAVGGTTPTLASVLSAMVTSVNRVNGVFEKEFSMHANLIANDDTLIFLPGSGDPYTNNSGSAMLTQNKTTINARIGTSNYDYGHVFSTGGGGIASLTSVCGNNKAQGVTGSSNPVGDPFDIDYVAHEMGHQFGGNHTFNSVIGSCNGNRSSSSAYEIGSATTIQGYAGICGTDDIQPHSDDYYHIRSLEEMTGNTIKACAVKTASGNTPPVLTAINKTYIIPYLTPFELTATATDANNDPLTFCWEEYDRGGSGGAWDATTTVAPMFRSFYPDTSGTRVFPQYKELIKNTETYLGERLPEVARILKFRCTARDMHLGNGSFYTSTDTVKLDVRTTTSLFRVTSQNTSGISWDGFSQQTVTWDFAGTNAAPFNVSNVDIYLSTDSGKTWPYLLASNVSNNGSQIVYPPNVDATWCRIKVKAAGNVFFDLNDNWIALKKVTWATNLNSANESSASIYPNPSHGKFNIDLGSKTTHAEIEIINAIGEKVFTTETKSQITLTPLLNKGIYFVKIKSNDEKIMVRKIIID